MPDQILRPNEDSYISISYPNYPTNPHYVRVSDQIDALNNCVSTDVLNDWRYDTYALPNPTRIGVVINVRVYARCQSRPAADGQKCKTVINSGGTIYYGAENLLQGSVWNNYYTDYSTNPKTSLPWTWDEVDALLAGVSLYGKGSSASYAECSEVWVVVTSIPVGGGAQIIGLSAW